MVVPPICREPLRVTISWTSRSNAASTCCAQIRCGGQKPILTRPSSEDGISRCPQNRSNAAVSRRITRSPQDILAHSLPLHIGHRLCTTSETLAVVSCSAGGVLGESGNLPHRVSLSKALPHAPSRTRGGVCQLSEGLHQPQVSLLHRHSQQHMPTEAQHGPRVEEPADGPPEVGRGDHAPRRPRVVGVPALL